MRPATLAFLGAVLMVPSVQAEEAVPTADEIIEALLPLDAEGRRIKGARSFDLTSDRQQKRGRGVKVEGGEEVPFIDLRVAFEYDSDRLSNDAMLTLQRLAAALSNEQLQGSKFRIVGHTDARGTAEYNQGLSERRARSVAQYLVEHNYVTTDRLEVAARGKSELIADYAPEDERQRRVEIQNIGKAN